jgi:hypothetical protein
LDPGTDAVERVVVLLYDSAALAVTLTRGRYPDSACGTASSVTRTWARDAFNCGLF